MLVFTGLNPYKRHLESGFIAHREGMKQGANMMKKIFEFYKFQLQQTLCFFVNIFSLSID